MRLGCVDVVLSYAAEARPGRDPFAAALEEAAQLGLVGLGGQPNDRAAPSEVTRLAELAATLGIRVEPKWGDRYAHPEAVGVRPVEVFAEWLDRVCVPLQTPVVGLIVRGGHRYLHAPPLDEQLALIAQRLRPLADVAATRGIRLALENHADYWAPEIVTILREVDRPNLGVRLDTGNPLAVAEDPLACARLLAPFTFTTHFKDMDVYPEGRADGPRVPHMMGAALGSGIVPLRKIVEVLLAHAPNVADLPLNIEIDWPPPEADARAWAEASIAYCRETFAPHLTAGGARATVRAA